MKKFIFILILVMAMCVPVQAEILNTDNIVVDTVFDILKATNSGYYFPITVEDTDDDDLDFEVSYTTTIASFDIMNSGQMVDLDVGYVVDDVVIAGLSYELGNLKKFSEVPVLDLINLSVGLFGSYDCDDNKAGIGINVRVIEWKF